MSSYSDLPADQTLGPDKDGVITEITHYRDDEGRVVRVTRRLRQSKIKETIRPRVLARRKWKKFGQAVDDPANITVRDLEEQILDLYNKNREEEKQEDLGSKLAGKESIVVCRNCGESGHWTRSCQNPTKVKVEDGAPAGLEDLGLSHDVLGKILGTPSGGAGAPAGAAAGDSSSAAAGAPETRAGDAAGGDTGKYIPRHKLPGGSGARGEERPPELNTIRISNLPETVTDYVVMDLVRQFGPTQRVFVAKDPHDPTKCRGFAYINYVHAEDAQTAMQQLHKKGLMNHILHVELAKPRVDSDRERDRRAFAAAAAHQPSARRPWR